MGGRLLSSWELKDLLDKAEMPDELRTEVQIYITNNKSAERFSNLICRADMHYMLDKIAQGDFAGLLKELQDVNKP
jgi:hypothetical protein